MRLFKSFIIFFALCSFAFAGPPVAPQPTGGPVVGTTGDFSGDVDVEGTITGFPKQITKATTGTLLMSECSGTVINNYGQGAANTQTLEVLDKIVSATVVISTAGAGAFYLKAGATDKIYLNGVACDDGDKVGLVTPAVGDTFSFYSFQNGASSYDINVISGIGTVVDSGA